MQFSENTNNLFAALAKFQSECPQITKDASVNVSKGGQFKYKFDYATYGNILRTVKPVLSKNELAVMQDVSRDGVQTIITHSSGQWAKTDRLPIINTVIEKGENLNSKEQETGSSITYKKRYQLAAVLLQDADMDDDGNTADGNEPQITKKSTNQFEPVTKPVDPPKEKKEEPKKQEEPKPEPQKDDSDSSQSEGDILKEIKAINDKTELVKWWKAHAKDDEYKQYKEQVFNRLGEL